MKKFGPEAKAARAEAARATALKEAQREAAVERQKAKDAEARAKQAELRQAAMKLEFEREEQKRQRAWAERERKLIGARSAGGAGGSGSRGAGGSGSDDRRAREDHDRDDDSFRGENPSWEPRGASLWDHVDAASRTKKKTSSAARRESTTDERRTSASTRSSMDVWPPDPPPGSGGSGGSGGVASRAAFPSLSAASSGTPAGSSAVVSGRGSPSGAGAASAPAPDHPARAMQVWMQRCRSGCPPDHEARPLLDDLIKKRVKSLIDSVGGVAARVDWATQDTAFAERCVRRAEQERETLRALEARRRDPTGPTPTRASAGGAPPRVALLGIPPSALDPRAALGSAVAEHIRGLIAGNADATERNVRLFLARTRGGGDSDDSLDAALPPSSPARLCAASVLRRAPEAAVNVLRSYGFEEWACRLHVLLWGSPFAPGGETHEDFERADAIESRYASDAAVAWLNEDAYARMGFAREDAFEIDLEGVPQRSRGVEREAGVLRDAYLLGLPRDVLETAVARSGGDVFRGVAEALAPAGAAG